MRFPVEELRPAIVTLLDPSGTPLPAGSLATLYRNGGSRVLPVGFGGEVYIEDLGDGTQIEVERDGGQCSYHLRPETGAKSPLQRMRVLPTSCGGER